MGVIRDMNWQDRQILTLFFDHAKNTAEIARSMSLSEPEVCRRLHARHMPTMEERRVLKELRRYRNKRLPCQQDVADRLGMNLDTLRKHCRNLGLKRLISRPHGWRSIEA